MVTKNILDYNKANGDIPILLVEKGMPIAMFDDIRVENVNASVETEDDVGVENVNEGVETEDDVGLDNQFLIGNGSKCKPIRFSISIKEEELWSDDSMRTDFMPIAG
ncbi:hypothetical protein GH714_007986 [Hevea brasiliensis]|uniref:Uncharacterized protein n=1 Tax=Hevea brasiliensis TaxID=3981 RepID=A0A6A6LBV4_HEVBR|nr:hypothetical protein GH714_007986 [Hevea brasiliensis]